MLIFKVFSSRTQPSCVLPQDDFLYISMVSPNFLTRVAGLLMDELGPVKMNSRSKFFFLSKGWVIILWSSLHWLRLRLACFCSAQNKSFIVFCCDSGQKFYCLEARPLIWSGRELRRSLFVNSWKLKKSFVNSWIRILDRPLPPLL